ncbi:MAG TPA: alpha/beta fold hydrolase [Methylomirabilota bacterium]|nr:alpha/beta fold hydrolase [Methylomirabilota bacterium]
MPTVGANGVRLFYEETGAPDAPPLVLIMGWGGDHTAWAFQVPALAVDHRVIALDNRGAGQSDVPEGPYTIPGMATDVVGLMDALGVTRAHICGASMGGMIAQELALRHPARVRTLQLHCTAPVIDAYGRFLIDTLLAVKARGDREENVRAVMPWLLCRKTMIERPDFIRFWIERALAYPYPTGYEGLARQADAIRGHDTTARLGEIRVPTLLTTGAEDILVPPASSRELHARIPGAELVTIPDAGHLHFIEQMERFNAVCLEFLRKHRGA